MQCVMCKTSEDEVSDTREIDSGRIIRRKRKCKNCGSTFTTFEFPVSRPDPESDVKVVKRDRSLEPFSFQKLCDSLRNKTFSKRGISEEQVTKVAAEVTAEIMHLNNERVESQEIGEVVLKKLRKIDEVAYIRYMVYFNRGFETSAELKDIIDKGPQVKKERKARERKRTEGSEDGGT